MKPENCYYCGWNLTEIAIADKINEPHDKTHMEYDPLGCSVCNRVIGICGRKGCGTVR